LSAPLKKSMKDYISLLTDEQTYIPKETSQLFQLRALLTSSFVQSLLRHHPNELANGDRQVPFEWLTWQSWCKGSPRRWLELVHYYISGTQCVFNIIPFIMYEESNDQW